MDFPSRPSPRAQDCLPLTITRVLEQIEAETGLFGSVVLGGPEPSQGGKVIVMS